jgi:hypothetical protein
MLDTLTLVEQRALPALPEARPATKEKMLAIAALIDVPVDIWPHRSGILPTGCWWLPQASLALFGTACTRPMLFDEVRTISGATSLSELIVRDYSIAGVRTRYTFDAYHEGSWHVRHLLWISEGGSGWLVPDLGGGPYLRLAQFGLEVTQDAPFCDVRDRFAGLDRGADYLSSFIRWR